MVSRISTMVLGLLMEGEKHGYELVKAMDERGMLRWTPASKVAVYRCLSRLQGEGCLTSWVAREGSAPEKRVYALTSLGEERLRDLVYSLCASREPLRFGSCVGLPFLKYLERDAAVDALENRLQYIQGQAKRIRRERDMLQGLGDDIFWEILQHELAAYREEARWLARVIDKVAATGRGAKGVSRRSPNTGFKKAGKGGEGW